MKKTVRVLIAVILVTHGTAIAGDALLGRVVNGLSFQSSVQQAQSALGDYCADLYSVNVAPAILPVAEFEETHLLCSQFTLGTDTVERVVLTFADGKLALMYATGNAAGPFIRLVTGDVAQYMNFEASFDDLLLAKKETDEVWMLSPGAAHVGLFQWSNFLAVAPGAEFPAYDKSVNIPSVLKFGQTLDELRPQFEKRCSQVAERSTDTWLLTNPQEQVQIDCFGYEFAGFPRKIEAVFGDGVLEQAWLLTAKAEERRLLNLLIQTFGEVAYETDSWFIFANPSVMLRTDKPEVLFLSEKLAPMYRESIIDRERGSQ